MSKPVMCAHVVYDRFLLLFTPYLVIAGLTRNPPALSVTMGSRIKSGMTNLLATERGCEQQQIFCIGKVIP